MIYNINGKCPLVGNKVFIAKSADIIGDVRIAENSSVWFGVVLRGDIEYIQIGKNTNIQDLTVCHNSHNLPMIIGDNVTVGHSVKLHSCIIEDNTLIGIGANILDGAVVGYNSIIADGTIISPKSKIPPCSLVMGAPGKTKRKVTDAEIENILKNAANYIDLKNIYLQG